MTGLLVSVRDAAEAQAALRGGAALIDVKEPLNGSLGSASPEVWRQVRAVVPRHIPCSAALGELKDVTPQHARQWRTSLAGFQFVKLGLAGCGDITNWQAQWQDILQELLPETRPVAVVYADWQSACAPPPSEILSAAVESACSALLVDTFDKSRDTLKTHFSFPELQHFHNAARAAKLATVLAGSLMPALIRDLLPLAPDFVAVRGAVCRDSRAGRVDELLVADLVRILLSTRDGGNQNSTSAKAPFAA